MPQFSVPPIAKKRPFAGEACTKIIATLGPASDSVEMITQLIQAGADVFRINTAHGDRASHQQTLDNVRQAAAAIDFHAAVLVDLAGPKIRLGELVREPLQLNEGMSVSFVAGQDSPSEYELTSTYDKLISELDVGDRVMLADGLVALRVTSVGQDHAQCIVTGGGEIRSRQGINLPGVKLSVAAMLPRDIDNAIWAAQNGVDIISLSFVRSPKDVQSLRDLLVQHNSSAMVVAKIEKPEALACLEEIVDATDAIMVARGDLGVEIDIAETPVAQKRIIRVCRSRVKPVIVATQMLESMHHHSRPTRAEVSDVANAILDGADACMLSGETAIGDHPIKAVQIMNRIMCCTENDLTSHSIAHSESVHRSVGRVHQVTSAMTEAATNVAESIGAKLVVIATRSGNTAWVKSQSRSIIPTLGVSESVTTLRRMNLMWGIKPFHVESVGDPAEFIDAMCLWGKEHGLLTPGDRVVFMTGTKVIEKVHNSVVVHTVK
jgi:pyruvate kinase